MSGIFVLGGAASGKSVWAEEYVKSLGRPMIYVATGQIFDAEVAARVKVHKSRRGGDWHTIEAPIDIAGAIKNVSADSVVLIDCATMWLTNVILEDADVIEAQERLLATLRTCSAPWVIVSNEVGQGIVPENALARTFREAQGRLNIALAAESTVAVQVVAGLPQVLKGSLQ